MKTSTTIPEVTHFLGIKEAKDWCNKPYPKVSNITRLDNGMFQVQENGEHGDFMDLEVFEFTHYAWFGD